MSSGGTTTIREFLVALGFKVDTEALKHFTTGIDTATKAVFGLAATIEGTAVAVAAGIERFSSNLEALYFASIKTQSAASNLKAFGRAAEDFGASNDEALQSVQSLAKYLRYNPGGEGYLKTLIPTRDQNGKLRDATDLLTDLGKKLATMQPYMQANYAGIFGLSDNTLRAITNPNFAGEQSNLRDRLNRSDWQKVTKDAHLFQEQIRDLETTLEAFGVKVLDVFQNKLHFSVANLTDYFEEHGDELADRLISILTQLWDWAEKIVKVIAKVIDKLIEWDQATNGLSTKLLEILVLMRYFGGFQIVTGILGVVGAFVKLGSAIASTNAAAAAGSALAGGGVVGMLARLTGVGAAAYTGYKILGPMINDHIPEEYKNALGERLAELMASVFRSGPAATALAQNNPAKFLQNLGHWTSAQAAGLVYNLDYESQLNPHAVGDGGKAYGIAQWHPDRQKKFSELFGHDIRQSDLAEQLQFVNWELTQGNEQRAGKLLRAQSNVRSSAETVAKYYERPGDPDEAGRRGRAAEASIHVEVTNHQTINGSDPVSTARHAGDELSRVAANTLRNTKPLVQ